MKDWNCTKMSNINIHNADVIEWLKNYTGPKFHSVISDPPYGLAFMGKAWDKYTPKQYQEWVTQWASLLLEHLYPGAVCMFFGGTRTYHRLATGLEDAGFEIFDSMMWCYGSGFPKSTNVGKKLGGIWNGYLTSLKPAFEPVVLCRKPRGKETFVDCALNYGTGALNVDGTRIQTTDKLGGGGYSTPMNEGWDRPYRHDDNKQLELKEKLLERVELAETLGRFPANLGLICDCECEPCECIEKELDNNSGYLLPAWNKKEKNERHEDNSLVYGKYNQLENNPNIHNNKGGGASRFFYTAKSSRKERNLGLDKLNNHPTVKPIKLIEYLATMLKPPVDDSSILIPFSGSGSEIIGAMFAGWNNITGIEIDSDYVAIADERIKYWSKFDSYDAAMKSIRTSLETVDKTENTHYAENIELIE